MGHWKIRRRGAAGLAPPRTGGWALIELTASLFLLMGIAIYGMKAIVSAFLLQNWSIVQSMTDAQAGIETAYAQRDPFANLSTDGRWAPYPASVTTVVPIGRMPSVGPTPLPFVTATAIRTRRQFNDPATGAVSYLLESYVVYQEGPRIYFKISKVYRTQ